MKELQRDVKEKPFVTFIVVVTALAAGTLFLLLPALVPYNHGYVDKASLAKKVRTDLGMDLPALENSLALNPVTTGEEPFILTYSIPLNVEVSTWTHIPKDYTAHQRILMLLDNGKHAQYYEFIRQSNNTYLVKWNTTPACYGKHTLQLLLAFGALGRYQVYGPKRTETVTNLVQWDGDSTGFGGRTWFHGFLHVPSADYKIDIYDTNKNLLNTITGHTDKGVIDEIWDLKTADGKRRNKRKDEEFEAQVYVTPTVTGTNGVVRSNAPTVRIPYP